MEYTKRIFAGPYRTGHCQGIAVDRAGGYVYYSFTTMLLKTDLSGRVIGSVKGLTGHLGCIDFREADGRVYGSLEYKNDEIGRGILARAGLNGALQDGFYAAVFDVDRIDRPDMDACTDGVMRAVWLREPLEWYKAPGHRYGCSGIDGTGFGPMFGAPDVSKEYLFIACGIYGDPSRTDNDHQILLCYDVDGWDALAQPLSQASPHTSGPARADGVYFVYTGNTTYGVQNLEYDAFSRRWFMAVYPGRKPDYPNPPLLALDASRPPVRARLHGLGEEGMTLSLDGRGQRGYDFPWGSTGLYAFGDGRYYVSHEGRTPEGDTSEVVLYRWDGEAPFAEAGE